MKKLLILFILVLMSFGVIERDSYVPFRVVPVKSLVKWDQRSIKLDSFIPTDSILREFIEYDDFYWNQMYDGLGGTISDSGYYFVVSGNGLAIFDQSTELDSEGLGEIKFRATLFDRVSDSDLTYKIYVHMDELFGGELESRDIIVKGVDRITLHFIDGDEVYEMTRSRRLDSLYDNSPYRNLDTVLVGNIYK